MEQIISFVDESWRTGVIEFPHIRDMRWLTKTKFTTNNTIIRSDVAVEISCQSSYEISNFWEVDTEIEVQLRNSDGNRFRAKMDCCFKNNALICTFDKLGKVWNDYRGDTFTRQVTFKIKSITGIEIKEDIDFSIPRDIGSEVELLVGDTKYYVNRYGLMAISPVFREILANSDEIRIQNMYYKDVLDFLRILHREEKEILSANIPGFLKLAHRFDIQFLMSACEDFLLSTGTILNDKKLDYAEMYNLSKLQVEILKGKRRNLKRSIPADQKLWSWKR